MNTIIRAIFSYEINSLLNNKLTLYDNIGIEIIVDIQNFVLKPRVLKNSHFSFASTYEHID